MSADTPAWIAARRSIRRFAPDPVAPEALRACLEAACLAPAPHHSRPWRFVTLGSRARLRLARGMADAWRRDLARDGVTAGRIDALCDASVQRIGAAPAAVLACLVHEGLDRYPDETRQRAEWAMAELSLGAALQNLMLTATAQGLASCWIAAPIFCPDAAGAALDLDPDVRAEALVLLGRPDPAYRPRPRPDVDLTRHLLQR